MITSWHPNWDLGAKKGEGIGNTEFFKGSGGSGTFATHLNKHHRVGLDLGEKKCRKEAEADVKITAMLSSLNQQRIRERRSVFPEFDPAKLNAATIRALWKNLVVAKSLSLRLVRAPELRALLHYINPYANVMLPTSHTTIYEDMKHAYQSQLLFVKQALREAMSQIHFSIDNWSSPNKYGLLGVVFHFVGKNGIPLHLAVALKEIYGEHSGSNMASMLLDIFQSFGILGNLGYLIADNATPNNTCASWLDQWLLGYHGVKWDCETSRIRCNGHIINLSRPRILDREES